MGKGLGVAAIVLAVISIVMPVTVNVVVVDIALMLAIVAALFGELPLTISTVVLSAVSILLLSPLTMYGLTHRAPNAPAINPLLPILYILLTAPLVALVLNRTGRLAFGRKKPLPGE